MFIYLRNSIYIYTYKHKKICVYIYLVAGKMPFSQKCAKIVNSWGPATHLDMCVIYLTMTSKPQGINRGKGIVAFVENVASARHFQPLSEKDGEVLLSDSAMFCSARLW